MLELEIAELSDAIRRVAVSAQHLHTVHAVSVAKNLNIEPRWTLTVDEIAPLHRAAESLVRVAADAELDATHEAASRLLSLLDLLKQNFLRDGLVHIDENNYQRLNDYLKQTDTAVGDQLRSRYALMLSASDKRNYLPKEPLFGAQVFDRFAIANDDIAEAGKCLALERGTATVFHLMRVMEVGLRALGKELGIPYAPSWESYIKQLESLLDGKNYDKLTAEQKAKRDFYRDVLGDLTSI